MCKNGCYPSSPVLVLAQLLILPAWSSSMVAFLTCSFVRVDVLPIDDGLGTDDARTTKLGLFRREISEGLFNDEILDDLNLFECTRYSEAEKDNLLDFPWKTAHATTVIAFALGFLLVIISLAFCCVSLQRRKLQVLGGFCVLFSAMELLSLLVFAADLCQERAEVDRLGDCYMSVGSRAALASGLMWFSAGIILCVSPGPKNEDTPSFAAGNAQPEEAAIPAEASTEVEVEVKPATEEVPSKEDVPMASATAY